MAIGLEMGSKPGARICSLTGVMVSASTVLRILKSAHVPPATAPRVLGVDDFAFRKRETYGTILVDLEKRQPVDLLPDREGQTLEKWLFAHPGVVVVSRDRSSVYAQAIGNACPLATQVADCWHLLKNLGENTARYLDRHRPLLKEAAEQVVASPDPMPVPTMSPATVAMQQQEQSSEKRQAVFEQVKELQRQGHSLQGIARHLGISRNTVRIYFRLKTFVPKTHQRRTNLLEYEAHLRQRWQEGEQCGKSLLQEIKGMGYTGSSRR